MRAFIKKWPGDEIRDYAALKNDRAWNTEICRAVLSKIKRAI
jgi:hypothetical protein